MANREETLAAIERTVSGSERLIASEFMAAVEDVRDLNTLRAIEEAARRGPDAVAALFSADVLGPRLERVSEAIRQSVTRGAETQASVLDPVRGPLATEVQFEFDGPANPSVGAYAEEIGARRVREIGEDVRGVLREVAREETLAGRNPLTAARRLRESIGLTAKQEKAISNYRRMLEEGDMAVLRRQLRDRRFDSTTRRAILNGKPLSEEKIDRMVNRYRERYVKYRSETIARTEATRAVQGGGRLYLEEKVQDGTIDERQVRREWIYTRDTDTRVSHRQIPALNPQGVGMRQPFETPLGQIMFPGDPAAAPEMSINCRCAVFQRVLSAELVGL